MTHSPDTPATPEGDVISRALPNAYYECAGCTQQGSESNCRPSDDIRLAPDETWLCEYCYDDAAYECGEDANWPVWADLPKLSAALTAQPVAQDLAPEATEACAEQTEIVIKALQAAKREIDPRFAGHHENIGFAIRRLRCLTQSFQDACRENDALRTRATPAPVEAGLHEAIKAINALPEYVGEQSHVSRGAVLAALRAQSSPVGETPVTVGVDLASGPDQTAVTLINPTQAALDVLAERQRQISAEGWTPEYDDQYGTGEMAGAAACYALTGVKHLAAAQAPGILWPWAKSWWKPTTTRRDLVKAGALILAEMERLDRATPHREGE